jgi:hypothetical protein
MVDEHYVVAPTEGGLQLVNVSNPEKLLLVVQLRVGFLAMGVATLSELHLRGGRRIRGLVGLDASDPENIVKVGSVDASYAAKVPVADGHAYVAGGSDLLACSLQDPKNPGLVGEVEGPVGTQSLFLVGDTAYVAAHENGLHVFDIQAPEEPALVTTVDTRRHAGRGLA